MTTTITKSATQPIYLVPKGDEAIKQWKHAFELFAAPYKHTFTIDVYEELVEGKHVAMVQEMISVLQHYPHLIEKMLFALEFKFTEVEDSNLYLPDECWKADPRYYRWFAELSKLPIMVFFINDEDARYYTLLGDMLADGSLSVGPLDKNERSQVSVEGKEWQQFLGRLFNSCWMMLLFCHNTGFNPEPYIQSLLADLDMSQLWDDIYRKYEKDVRNNIHFRAVPTAV